MFAALAQRPAALVAPRAFLALGERSIHEREQPSNGDVGRLDGVIRVKLRIAARACEAHGALVGELHLDAAPANLARWPHVDVNARDAQRCPRLEVRVRNVGSLIALGKVAESLLDPPAFPRAGPAQPV